MKRSMWLALVLVALTLASASAWAEDNGDDSFPADSCFGSASALTAVGRLGPVRIVVYDPVSNSFAFVIPCSDALRQGGMSKEDLLNRQYLDSHRLALTTQKIRLLIMPYNPVDGNLTLQDSRSQGGIEFAETPIASLPKTQEAKQTATSQPGKSPTPKVPSQVRNNQLAKKLTDAAKATADAAAKTHNKVNLSSLNNASQPTRDLGDKISQAISKWNNVLEGINADMLQLQFEANCVRAHIEEVPIHVSQQLSGGSPQFNLAKDVPLSTVLQEAERRIKLVKSDGYESCFGPKQSLEQDTKTLEDLFSKVSKEVDDLEIETDNISELVQQLASTKPPATLITPDDWKDQVASYQDTATALESHQQEIEAERNDLLQQLNNGIGEADNFKKILNSPALQLQRRTYNPLASGESITFIFTRNEVKTADGATTVVPKQSNTLELRSAPVYTIRFGTGIVVSGLRDPSFKTGTDPNDSKKKTILFDDQGQNQVLPALFVHHYWGWRSPLLKPTRFERYMPTLSLGIPLAKADVLQQVLFGLDWELVPGLELNLGAHWGKVNALNNGYRVGSEIPSTLDVTTIQQKRFRTAFYAGIVLNSDSFASFFGQQK